MTGYAFSFQGKPFTPDGADATITDVDAHNAKLEQAELAHWATRPDRWQVYVKDGSRDVTTWLGTKLGTITERTQFRTNMSRNVVAIRFQGTNGATYYGRYGADHSQLCRVRRAKT